MSNHRVIGLGEVLWDLLPSDPQFGGAPSNFAWHAHALGAHAQIISRVGNDKLGHDIRTRLAAMALPDNLLQTDQQHATGTVTVALSESGHPEYTIHENVAWDHIAATEDALVAVRNAGAICFGSLAQRNPASRNAIQTIVSAARPDALRIFDINLRQHYFNRETIDASLKLANVLKLNDAELPILSKLFNATGDVKSQIEFFANEFSLRVIALTRGAHGSVLFQNGRWSEQPSIRVEVKDSVGAGDSFTAALCIGLLRALDLDHINTAANQIAAYVCSHSGATPQLPQHLRHLLT